uniref:Proteolipid protein 2 n=1 Tax=Cynoglossus semilaevis TaxID=244447 RepID=A0A3P8X329_CYNSE
MVFLVVTVSQNALSLRIKLKCSLQETGKMSHKRVRKGNPIICLIILICYAASLYGGYSAVAICEMIFAIVFFVIFMMELDKQIQVVSWVWSDLFRAGIGALIYLITSLICVIGGAGDGARIAGVWGLIAGLLFAYDTYTIYLQIKSSRQHTAASTDDRV